MDTLKNLKVKKATTTKGGINMYHTLKTLYEWCSAHNPQLVQQFSQLKDYCYDADELNHKVFLNRGYKSLKWLIYTLRNQLLQKEIEMIFYYCLIEANLYGEQYLYDDVFKFGIVRQYSHLLKKPKLDLSQFPIIKIGGWKVLINKSDKIITNLVFKKRMADIIIFKNPQNWAGIVFNERDTNVLDYFDLVGILEELKLRNEGWIRYGNNLIICGGPKAPDKTTTISTELLLTILKQKYTKK